MMQILFMGIKVVLAMIIIAGTAYVILYVASLILQGIFYLFGRSIGNINTWIKKIWKKRNKSIMPCGDCRGQYLVANSYMMGRSSVNCTLCGKVQETNSFSEALKFVSDNKRK